MRWRAMLAALVVVAGIVVAAAPAFGQLSGTYTIGGAAPSYTTIDAAIAALDAAGVSGPVTFRIRSGTYVPPSGGYVLRSHPGMSAANTVTFKPDAGAAVTISGSTDTLTAVFMIDGGQHYIIDGSNAVGGTTRDMLIRETRATTNPAIWMQNDADFNVVKNCVVVGNGGRQQWGYPQPGMGAVYIGITNTTSGNDSNVVQNNRVGDTTGTYRSNIGIAIQGWVAEQYVGNIGNKILHNDVVNFGFGNGFYSIGIVMMGNQLGTLIEGNDVHMTVPSPSPYVWGIAMSPGSYSGAEGTVINANRVFKLTSTWDGYSNIGILIDCPDQAGPCGGTSRVSNNMVSMVEDGDYAFDGINVTTSSGVHEVYHNTIYLGGTAAASSFRVVRGFVKGRSDSVTFKDNIINSTRTGGRGANYGLYLADTNGYVGDYNMISFHTTSQYYTAFVSDNHFSSQSRLTFNDYQRNSGQDAHSFEGTAPFVDAANGNLHIDPSVIWPNSHRGTPIAVVPTDYDGDRRDAVHPDIGADEAGDVNQGGIHLTYPNGGQKFGVGDTINVGFTVNRALNVRVDFSTNAGATWTNGTPRDVAEGARTITITAPAVVTQQARVRVVSTVNTREGDSSDQNFELVEPILTVVAPNGGETLVPTDHARIEFSARYLTAGTRLRLDYSTDNGATWIAIDTNVYGASLPAVNAYDWTVPNTPTSRARVRVKLAGGNIADTSDASFTITDIPSLTLTAPSAGQVLYVGDKITINWQSVMTNQVRLTYSTDGGTTWQNVVPNGAPLAAAGGTYSWTVPNTPTEQVQLRITNVERTRFTSTVNPLVIRRATVEVLSPNGGEQFESGTPVTVTWQASNTGPLTLEYSNDNGVTWRGIAGGIAAGTGSYTFTPPPEATRFAFVRLTDPARQSVNDRSDRAFEILRAPTIMVLAPATGDLLSRNTPALIVWDAARIASVDIFYSSNNGIDWQPVAAGVSGASGSYTWTTPDETTDQGKIRIRQTGGDVMSESGTFSIVTRAPVAIRVLAPNGGESYTPGDTVAVRWTASSITTPVEVAFSSDGGATWQRIGAPAATDGTIQWIVNSIPGNNYRVRVGTGNIVDASDAPFSVLPRQDPSLAVLAPNGGERFTMDSVTEIRWSALNIGGDIAIEFSSDGGATWSSVQTASAASGSISWTVPAIETERALIRITSVTGSVTDISDAPFAIVRRAALPLALIVPNGGERWLQNTDQIIRWNAAGVSTVNLEYSIDGGGTWSSLRAGIASAPGTNDYNWRTPGLTFDADNTVLVRITNAADGSIADVSDHTFSLLRIAGADAATTGLGAERLLGNYPNPFAGSTEIRWIQHAAADVQLRLYDGNGRLAGTYNAGHREQGEQRFELRAGNLAAGVYAYEVQVGGKVMRSMLIVAR